MKRSGTLPLRLAYLILLEAIRLAVNKQGVRRSRLALKRLITITRPSGHKS